MNPRDAAELVRWAISALAGDTSEEAMECLAALRAAPQDSYSDLIRHSAAQQRCARNEANFAPVTPARIAAVACNKPPASIDDLHVVLWFGDVAAQTKRLTRPPQGAPPVHSAADLCEALQHRIPEVRRGQLAVVVIDLVR
jgi:hypothetical protein